MKRVPWYPNVPLALIALSWKWAAIILGISLAVIVAMWGASERGSTLNEAPANVRGSSDLSARGAIAPSMSGSLLPRTLKVTSSGPTTINAPEPVAYIPPETERWSCAQIQQAMMVQGFSLESAMIGSSIAMAESGGRGAATHVTDHEWSVGPYQVNLLVHRQFSEGCARSLTCSTAIVWRLSRGGTNWNPWSVYKSGAYEGRCA